MQDMKFTDKGTLPFLYQHGLRITPNDELWSNLEMFLFESAPHLESSAATKTKKKSWVVFGRKVIFSFLKRFDRGDCNNKGLVVSKLKREGHDRRKPAVPRTNLICSG
jgi:hypothetical protein